MECMIKDVKIHYEVIGSGKPIVMLHGYHVDHRILSGCMEPIFCDKTGYKRIYFDLPGMGKSGTAEWIKSSDDLLEIVLGLIDCVIPGENFIIAGQSYGGYLARGVINKISHRVDGAILICPVILADNSKRNVEEMKVFASDEVLLSKLSKEEIEDFNSSVVVQSEQIYERYQNEIVAGVMAANSEFLQIIRTQGYEFTFDVDQLEHSFDKPTLFLLGKQDDCVGYKDALTILPNYPRATLAVLEAAGHALQLDQPEQLAALVNGLLNLV